MANVASIDMQEALTRIKRINESVVKINEGCKKLCVTLEESSAKTNLKSVEAIHTAFAEVGRNVSIMEENMNNVLYATEKYVEEVAAIDEEDNSIYSE